MKAQIIKQFGDETVFEFTDIPDPSAKSHEVLVRLHATSVNPVDWKIRRNGLPISPELPAVLGCDISGTVIDVGKKVTNFSKGDEVFGCGGGVKGMGGTYAELIAVDHRLLAKRPNSLNARQAAALPLVTITAWEGLIRSNLKKGDSILIHGGTGGVGHVAIQIAKSLGANVHTTVSSDAKAETALKLGADEAILYNKVTTEEYVNKYTRGKGFDVVFDATGGQTIAKSFEVSRLNGNVITIVSQYDADLSLMHLKGLSLHVVFMLIPMLYDVDRESHGNLMENAGKLADLGKLSPLIDPESFSLSDISSAHKKLENGQSIGKIVVDIN